MVRTYLLTWDRAHGASELLLRFLPASTVVVNSSDTPWINSPHESLNLTASSFFRDQFRRACEHFLLSKGDILFSVVGDAYIDEQSETVDFPQRILEVYRNVPVSNLGFSVPQSVWNSAEHEEYAGVYTVPTINDCHAWALSRSVVARLARHLSVFGKFGWGIDLLAAVISRVQDTGVYRDYSITLNNPPGTGYDIAEACQQMITASKRLPDDLRPAYTSLVRSIVYST